MVYIRDSHEGMHVASKVIAIGPDTPVEQVMKHQPISGQLFTSSFKPIEMRGFTVQDGSPTDVHIGAEKVSKFTKSHSYNELDGHHILYIVSYGVDEEAVKRVCAGIAANIQSHIDLKVTDYLGSRIQETIDDMAKNHSRHKVFFNQYQNLQSLLSNQFILNPKELQGGFLYDMFNDMCKSNDVSNIDPKIKLVNRMAGRFIDHDMELAMIFASNCHLQPNVYGTLLMTRDHLWDYTENARTFAGYIFNANEMTIGNSQLGTANLSKDAPVKKLNNLLDEAQSRTNHGLELKTLSSLAYVC